MTIAERRFAMVRFSAVMVTIAGVAIAGVAFHQNADAQSGQSLVFAEKACLDYGVPTNTPVFENCVGRAARAFDRGEPDLAYIQARATRDARESCKSFGMATDTSGYSRCIDKQIDRRMER
jgi:hypothetical protein